MKMTVAGLHPQYDGDYEIAMPPFVQREWHEIKQHTGLRPGDLDDALAQNDPDALAALIWVTLTRAGFPARQVWGAIGESDVFDSNIYQVAAEDTGEGDAASPPVSSTLEVSPEPPAGSGESKPSSGATTNGRSDQVERIPDPTGAPI